MATGCGSSWPASAPVSLFLSSSPSAALLEPVPLFQLRPVSYPGLNVRLLNAIFVARRAARTCTGPIGHKVRFIFVDFPLLVFCKRAWAQLLPTSRLLAWLSPFHCSLSSAHCPQTRSASALLCSALLCESPSDAVVTLCTLLRVREPSSNHNATR